jgi:hypothetical protein
MKINIEFLERLLAREREKGKNISRMVQNARRPDIDTENRKQQPPCLPLFVLREALISTHQGTGVFECDSLCSRRHWLAKELS